MNDVAKRLSRAALSLSPGDRLELVERLLDSLDAPDQSMGRLWAAEAEERLATVLAKYAAQ